MVMHALQTRIVSISHARIDNFLKILTAPEQVSGRWANTVRGRGGLAVQLIVIVLLPVAGWK